MASRPLDEFSLDDLMNIYPDEDDQFDIFDRLITEPDRVTAIIGSSLVEDAVRKAISTKLIPLVEKESEAIFDDSHDGPLKTFSSRIIMAFALGLVGPKTRSDLNTIRKIRNGFAHSPHPVTFDTKTIRDRCTSFHLTKQTAYFVDHDVDDSPKRKFVAICFDLWLLFGIEPPDFTDPNNIMAPGLFEHLKAQLQA